MSVALQTENSSMKPDLAEAAFDTVAVIIPALNEERSLPLVLADLPSVGEVIVVDNGSTDQTASLARAGGGRVIAESRRGYGMACLTGIAEVDRLVREEGRSFDVVLFADADYSDHVDAVANLIEPILNDQQDFVLGSRILGKREKGAMPPQSVYGNKFACWLMRMFVGKNAYTDLGPLRAIRYCSLKQLEMEDENFGWTIEMQMKAIQQNLRTVEVPVAYRRRIGVSKISGTISGTIKAGSKIIYSVWKYR
ncbi:glycosyltransferase family 2 protein [bacterium]|nr:glycosyltransferase family 2 protein [bacterium]